MWIQVKGNWVNLDKVGGIEFDNKIFVISFLIYQKVVSYTLGITAYWKAKRLIKEVLDEKKRKG